LKEYTQWVLDCLDNPILIDGEVKFVDPEEGTNWKENSENMDEFLDKKE
jgi:hypothetical protein